MGEQTSLIARLTVHLESMGNLAPTDLRRAQMAASAADKRLDQALVDLGLVSETALVDLLHSAFDVPAVTAADISEQVVVGDLLAPSYLLSAGMLPLAANETTLDLAMVNPYDDFSANAVAIRTRRKVRRLWIGREAFDEAITSIHGDLLPSIVADDRFDTDEGVDRADVELLRDSASDAPVIKFVQDAIRQAVEQGASDIHIRPLRQGSDMLFRIDGRLQRREAPNHQSVAAVLSRLKILANLDISERRLPQDGKIRTSVAGQSVDIRLSTMPHVYGEAAVLRILSRTAGASSLSDLGFSQAVQTGLEQVFASTDGLVLVTGPTGSGKSTTLYAALKRLIRPDVNVVTIEDPVEYRIDGAAQIQVDDKIGLTFPRVLRSLLRQDPDIILIGEIRDAETAKIAVQAALTGHLVLATLHTNSALAAVPRLVDMGVEPFLLGAVLRGVLAQRLVRRLCPHCSVEDDSLAAGALREHDADAWAPQRCGPGCPQCGGTGYNGRVAIGELALLDASDTHALAESGEGLPGVLQKLSAQGYSPLRQDALRRMAQGEIGLADLPGLAGG